MEQYNYNFFFKKIILILSLSLFLSYTSMSALMYMWRLEDFWESGFSF